MADATSYVYATPKDVQNYLLKLDPFDQNSLPSKGQIVSYIVAAEDEFTERTGTAYKPVFVEHELHDLQAWRERHRELFVNWFAVPRPIQLNHRPVLPLDENRGHKIEVYEGNDANPSTAEPLGEWTEFLSDGNRSYGRNNDFWLNAEDGELHVRKTFLFRRANLMRITYEFGKPITTIDSNGGISDTDSTIDVDSTYRYQNRGYIRIGDEYIFHSGTTGTSLTGCQRGQFGTEARSHNDGAEVYEVPQNIREETAKRAATKYLQNERFFADKPEGGSGASIDTTIQQWREDWNMLTRGDHQQWRLL